MPIQLSSARRSVVFTPLASLLRGCHVRASAEARAVREQSERASHRVKEPWRALTVRLANETRTPCVVLPKCPRLLGAGSTSLKGPWVVGGDVGDGAVRAGAHGGAVRAMRGVGAGCEDGEVGPPAGAHRVGGRLCVARAPRRVACSLAHARFLDPQALRERGRTWTVEEGDNCSARKSR